MRILVSIDDTDNIESVGTGKLAESLAAGLQQSGWGQSDRVTRHQLLVHEDIPYTSHNSAMCFKARIDAKRLDRFIDYAQDFLVTHHALGSDPGLCVAQIKRLKAPDKLIGFGRQAKQVVLTKPQAYETARRLGIHLSEHGGTGLGVIGAVAGAGLRLSGNDGRFKGHMRIASANGVVSVAEICRRTYVQEVQTLKGEILGDDASIRLGAKVKAVLLKNKAVLLVYKDENSPPNDPWATCQKQQLRSY